ncbi:MAG: hypothetical protein U0228_25805 [Myxococcaceae bacterium]
MAKIVIDTEFARLQFHEDEKIVHHEFKKPIRGQAFKDVLLGGLELLQKHGAKKWLSDDRKNFVLEAADESWARTEWFPKAQEAGWAFWAVCPPEKAVGQLQINRHARSYMQGGVEVKNCASPEEALEWLKSKG